MSEYVGITGPIWLRMTEDAKITMMKAVVAAFGVDGLSNILKFVPGGITGEEIEGQLGESKDYEKLLSFIDDDPSVTAGAKGTTMSMAIEDTNMNALDGGNRKARRSKTRRNKTRRNKTRRNKTRRSKTRRNKTRKNKRRYSKSRKNKRR